MPKQTSSTTVASQVRKHYYLDEFVVIAPKRKDRPFTVSDKPKSGLSIKIKPLPIENDPSLYEIRDRRGNWAVKVVENLYPAMSVSYPKAYGRQEIVLETPDEQKLFCELPVRQIMRVLKTYQVRVKALRKDRKLKHISIFKNHGFEAGASLAHTHSQIIGIDFVPPQIEREQRVFHKLYKQFGSSPLGAALEWEREQQLRIIATSMYVTAFAPYASRHPFEVWLVAHRHIPSVLDLTTLERESFARMLKHITSALDSRKISYNFYLHEGIIDHNHHFMIKVTPRPNIWAGFELDSGVIINSVAPEAAAKWYRSYIKEHSQHA